jgi:hypothetical protein
VPLRPWAIVLLLSPLALAGCMGSDEPAGRGTDLAAALDFSRPMDVETTPDEANEFRGFLRVAWAADGTFAVESETEPDLPRQAIVQDGSLYTSATGMGWVVQSLDAAVGERQASNRLVLWDLRSLIAGGDLRLTVTEEGERIRISGAGKTGPGDAMEVTLDVVAKAGVVETAEVDSPQGREGPFTFRPANGPLAFPIARPTEVRPLAEVRSLDGQAYDAHVQVIQLIQDYAAKRAGVLPDRIDADTLGVELLASGGSWPEGAYDGEALHDGRESGHFTWTRCAVADGLYQGYGWDGAVVTQSYGAGCAA